MSIWSTVSRDGK